MTLNLTIQKTQHTDFTPRITVIGVGGGGCNAVNNMIMLQLPGVRSSCKNPSPSGASSSGPISRRVTALAGGRKSARPQPMKPRTNSRIIWKTPICCSSPPAWGAAPALVLHP